MADTPVSPTTPVQEDPKAGPGLLWDWPTRLLHGSLASLFLAALAVASFVSEHSPVFQLHMLFGLLLLLVVLLRLVWGLAGSQPSRFSSFLYSPAALVRYVRDAAAGRDRPAPGHNPGSGYATFALLLLPLGLGVTGLAQGLGWKAAEEVHGALAYGMAGVVVLHLLGLAWHTVRHRENIAASMVTGRRQLPAGAAIPSARPLAGVAFLLLLVAGAVVLVAGLDPRARRIDLPGLGMSIPLGGAEGVPGAGPRHHGEDDD